MYHRRAEIYQCCRDDVAGWVFLCISNEFLGLGQVEQPIKSSGGTKGGKVLALFNFLGPGFVNVINHI